MNFPLTFPGVRKDTKDLFTLAPSFRPGAGKLKHNPFIVFDSGAVSVIDDLPTLMLFPDETQVMVQWPGQWRSDFFTFTVGDVRKALPLV